MSCSSQRQRSVPAYPPKVYFLNSVNVMSATQSWSGLDAVKLRSTRSGAGRASFAPGRRWPAMPVASTHQPGFAHQPRDPFTAVPFASCPQIGVNAGRAVGLARAGVYGPDPPQQRCVGNGMERRRTMPPSVETSLGHAEHARHGGNREKGLVRAHEPEEPDDTAPVSRANQAAAFDKMSRSGIVQEAAERTRSARRQVARTADAARGAPARDGPAAPALPDAVAETAGDAGAALDLEPYLAEQWW